jgi:PAS domain S-box-containing protein
MHFERMLAEAILGASGDAVIATDREGVIRFWNPGAERIFGHSTEEAIGQSLDLIIPERLRARHWEGYRQVMATGESRYDHGDLLSVPSMRSDGTRISVEFTIVPLKDASGGMDGVAAVMRDVTARFEEVKALRRQVAEASRPGSRGDGRPG